MKKEQKLVFMLVADEDDRTLTSRTLQAMEHPVQIRFLSDSKDLFAALQEATPSLLLLDYNLAPEPGVVLLQQLKSDARYRALPVIILTDSPLWQEHAQCYQSGASTVIKKPASGQMTEAKIRIFFDYWMQVAETLSSQPQQYALHK